MSGSEKKHTRKKRLGSYPFLSVVFSIFITLFVIGLFGYIMINANQLKKTIRENVEMQVYLRKNTSESELIRLSKTLSSKSYALVKEDQAQVEIVTKEQAAQEFIKDTGEDFVSFLGENPLRDVIVLKVEEGYHHPDSLAKVKKEISGMNGVFEVSYSENLVKNINDNLTVVSVILLGFALILLLAAIILINNTIKLALFSQRFIIRSMQLVGATAGFIQRPFLIRAAFYGFISGLLASAILYGLVIYLNQRLQDLNELQDELSLGILFGAVIVLGIIVGFGSSYRAIKKYLRMSLDELY